MSNSIEEQIERLRAAVVLFEQTFGRVPTVAFDADGVIYDFETTYLAHHNRCNPHLPPVVGPFVRFDVGYGHTDEVAEALQESMRTLDWSEIEAYPEARAVLPVLAEVGLDMSIATAHRTDNVYSPSAKVYQFSRDFDGYFDNRIQIGIDKTRVVADFIVDDKPEVKGLLVPQWQHIYFTQEYNKDIPGIHVVWETMFEVLAAAIEAKVAGRTLAPRAAVTSPSVPEQEAGTVAAEPLPAWEDETAVIPVDNAPAEVTMPWLTDDEPELVPVADLAWDDIVTGGDQK